MSTTTLQELKPSQIKPNKANPPGRTDDVTELAASIAAKGIVEPLIVAPNGDAVSWVLIAGHRRLAAAKLAKLKTVPCIVREDLTDPAAQLETMLIENLQRSDLTPIEEAEAYQQLLAFPGYTQKRITEATGRPAATVRARLKLAKLSDRARAKIHAGQITLADAAVLAEFADDEQASSLLEKAVGTNNWSYYVEQERRRRSNEKARERMLAEVRKSGVTVVSYEDLRKLQDDAGDDAAWVYVDPEGDELQVKPEEHASCPGHAAVLEVASVHYVCTSPDKHPELDVPGSDDETAEERADREATDQRRAEAKQLGEQLEIASQVRLAHLLAVAIDTVRSQELAHDLLKDVLGGRFDEDHSVRAVLGPLLCPETENPTSLDLRRSVAGFTLPALVVLLDLAENARVENALAARAEAWAPGRTTSAYYKPHEQTAKWRQKLVDVYGYEFSQVELDLLAPPAVADQPS